MRLRVCQFSAYTSAWTFLFATLSILLPEEHPLLLLLPGKVGNYPNLLRALPLTSPPTPLLLHQCEFPRILLDFMYIFYIYTYAERERKRESLVIQKFSGFRLGTTFLIPHRISLSLSLYLLVMRPQNFIYHRALPTF